MKRAKIECVASVGGTGIERLAVLSLIILTCYYVSIGEIAVGAVLSIYSIGTTFYNSILNMSWVVTQLFSMTGVRDNVEKIIDRETEEQKEPIALGDAITLKDVSFRYFDADERLILDNINLTIKNKCKYLIIGKSGSGKSTILKLICKFYNCESGTLTFDGVDYAEFTEGQINGAVAYCQQSGYLFNRTLKENIDFNKTGEMISLTK